MTRVPVNPFFAARKRRVDARIPSERPLQVLDLFSGIGGFSLGLERAGMATAAFCEIDAYCRRVLSQHWPTTRIYDNIKTLNQRRLHDDAIKHIDLICGGYPCQPFSLAGKRLGEKDPRHLWPEMHRIIREVRPRWVVCENVGGHVDCGLDTVLADLEADGYTTWTFIVPACAVGAPHRRDRVWIVAHTAGLRREIAVGPQRRHVTQELPSEPVRWDLPSPFTCGGDDGVPFLVDRLRALGNAVVPQIVESIGRAIVSHNTLLRPSSST